jgi:transcriptional regulator with XRE-family HTH domain
MKEKPEGIENMSVGQRIKQRRKELGMSADELGKRLGKDRSTIYRYEKGDIENLPLDILEPIAEVLRTTPQYLMGWEQVQKKNDVLSDIILKLNEDAELLTMVEALSNLGFEQREAVKSVLNAFSKADK